MKESLRRIFSVFEIRNKEFYRDKGALGWTLLFPLLMILSFSFLFKQNESEIYKIGVVGGELSQTVSLSQIVKYPDTDSGLEKLKYQKIDLLVAIGVDGKAEYWRSKGSPKSITAEALFRQSFSDPSQIVQNEISGQSLSYVEWLFPGLLAMNVTMMSLWGVGWVIVRQRKLGVLKRFKASPLSAFEYLFAQILSRLVVVSLTGVIVFAGANLIHPFPIEGSLFDLLVLYLLGCMSLSSVGLLLAARMESEELANGILNILIYPMIFLSEIWFSLEGSPEWVIKVAKWIPLWHLTDGMRTIMYEGKTLTQLSSSVIILLLITAVMTTAGSLSFKWNKET